VKREISMKMIKSKPLSTVKTREETIEQREGMNKGR
jgi:hypothetical protein